MFNRLANSWELVKASAVVLKADKELVLFPILSSIAMVAVVITFLVPTILADVFDSLATNGEIPIFAYIIAFLFYLVQYFVIFFFNSALVGAAMIRLRGGDPTVGDGLKIAFTHIGSILGYALISATVGIILRAIAERGGALGKIVTSLFGLAWSLATYLVVPILVIEGIGPIEAVKRSATLLKQTWGEQIVGNFGIGMVFGWITFGVILLTIPAFIAAASLQSVALMVAVGVAAVIAVALLSLLSSTLSGIYAAAVYAYAAEGNAGDFFDENLIENTFRSK